MPAWPNYSGFGGLLMSFLWRISLSCQKFWHKSRTKTFQAHRYTPLILTFCFTLLLWSPAWSLSIHLTNFNVSAFQRSGSTIALIVWMDSWNAFRQPTTGASFNHSESKISGELPRAARLVSICNQWRIVVTVSY